MSFAQKSGRIELASDDNYSFMIAPKPIPGTAYMLENIIENLLNNSGTSSMVNGLTYLSNCDSLTFGRGFQCVIDLIIYSRVFLHGDSWTALYVAVMASVMEDYPHIFKPGMSFAQKSGAGVFSEKM